MGSTVPVPNVQEIVRSDPQKVPEKYLRKYADACHLLANQIPTIDFSLLRRGHEEELNKLHLASKQWGVFQDAAAKFFELPLEEKDKISRPPDDAQGYGHSDALSEEEILEWSNALVLMVYPSKYRKLKFWPTTPKGFKEVIEAYSSEVKRIGEELLRSLSVLLGMEKDASWTASRAAPNFACELLPSMLHA
ncbi:hypothetical protein ACE6H2_021561 [Prunus campanulata]